MKILLPNSHLCLAIVAWQPGVRNKALTVSPPPTTTKSKVLKIEEMCQWPKGFRPDGLPVQSNDQEAMLSPTNARKGRLTNVLLQFKMHCVRHDHKPLCCVRSCQLQFTQTCTSKSRVKMSDGPPVRAAIHDAQLCNQGCLNDVATT